MRVTLKKTLAMALCSTAAVLMALLVLAAAHALGWPLWVWLFLIVLVAALLLAALLLRQFWLKRRALLHREPASPSPPATADKEGAAGIRQRWREALQALRASQLRKRGNPLYLFPWQLIVGASGSGKSAALAGGSLCTPAAAGNDPATATESFDWRLFDQTLVIDTAGRYATGTGAEDDRQWQALLGQLAKTRSREPLNGLIVAVAADRLQPGETGSLQAEGATIRSRIDGAMRALGVRLPVYLLITKCDLIEGFSAFTRELPEGLTGQALGAARQDAFAPPGEFVAEAFATVGGRLRDLRLKLLLQPRHPEEAAALALLPERLALMEGAAASFVKTVCDSDLYQETPLLRGIFFCSALLPGVPSEPPGHGAAAPARPVAGGGAFLHDLFAQILPKERWLFTPTRSAARWRAATGHLGLLCWLAFMVALAGLMSFSFVKNLTTVNLMHREAASLPEPQGDLARDLLAMEKYRSQVAAVEARNRHWWLPRFGLTASLQLEGELKSRFCRRFQVGVLAPFDRRLTAASPPNRPTSLAYARELLHLVRRINLLKALKGNDAYDRLRTMAQPDYLGHVAPPDPDKLQRMNDSFNACYLCYLAWRPDASEANREIALFQEALQRLIAGDPELRSLESWLDGESGIAPVTLAQFWGGSSTAAHEVQVAPRHTLKGREVSRSLLEEIEGALPGEQKGKLPAAFERRLRTETLAAWEGFAAGFANGSERLRGERQWQEAAARMAGESAPYFALLNRLATELKGESDLQNAPPWLRQLALLQAIKAGALAGDHRSVQQAAESGQRLLVQLGNNLGRDGGARELEARIAGAKAWKEYRDALALLAAATVSRQQAQRAAAQLYGEDPSVSKSPFVAAVSAHRRLAAALAAPGATGTLERLLRGPLDFLWELIGRQAAGQLQNQWEEQVLGGSIGMTPQQATPVLLGQDGLVWKFVAGPAAPFLTRSSRGYRAREVLGGALPFEPSFLSFLERGSQVQAAALSRQASYSVGIQALPTDANRSARIKPHATRLELVCGAAPQTLVNHNYPVGRTFTWSPESCGDLTLDIEIGDLLLTRRYPGPQALPEFLQAFPRGQRTFTPRDFPGARKALEQMGIDFIRVNYQFTGSGEVIRQSAAAASSPVPQTIARCWPK